MPGTTPQPAQHPDGGHGSPRLPATGRAWHLVRRPHGWPVPEDFALRETPVTSLPSPTTPDETRSARQPALADGHILVRNRYFSVDPYMRGRMNDVKSYVPPFRLDAPMDGGAVGEVIASAADGFAPGDLVAHFLGWREYADVDARHAHPSPTTALNRGASRHPTVFKVDTALAPLPAYLGVLGTTGLTAYAGLLEVASFKEGDAVFVSGAAGAVGSIAGQLARLKGASRVIGSAGSDDKVKLLREEYGFDAAFNYKKAPVAEQLKEAAPDGIDVYFDNVGGDHLEAAISRLKLHGRVTLCGMIAQYNEVDPPAAPRNLALAIGKRLRLQGMIVTDHAHLQPRFVEEVSAWIRSGELKYHETIVDGIEHGVDAFLGMLRGENVGKMVVSVGD